MQSATAITVPPAPPPSARRNLWILNSWRDVILYLGTPLLLLPLFGLAQTRFSAQDIYIFVGAFGATGQQLEEAKSEYLTALRAKPDLGMAYAKIGDVYLREGQASQAALQYEQALRIEPGNAAVAENLRRVKEDDRFTRSLP